VPGTIAEPPLTFTRRLYAKDSGIIVENAIV
jgi:hypothetical protein